MTEENSNTTYGKEVGNVIWFDQKKGFGFIRIINPNSEFLNKEIFVHYSNINCQSRFKKLYPGENVSVDVSKNTQENNGKEFMSSNLSGLYGAPLLVDNENYLFKVMKKRDNVQGDSEDQ
tara:strand:- start:2424 stop:2783 length:360 start_codon:yes stop_codon:yes gene_type:complete